MRFSRWWYYLTSLPTLLLGVTGWPALIGWLIRPAPRGNVQLTLRTGERFEARSLMDVWVIKETCLDQGYERAAVPIQPGWTVIDIGAGLGDFTVDAARKTPGGMVYAYEPFPGSFALLERNLALNRVDNARAFNLAVGAAEGSLSLRTDPAEPVMHHTAYSGQDGTVVEVPAVPLDRLFADLGIDRCDFLKIDTEGAEYDILMHAAPSTLAKIAHICLEYHDGFTPHSHAELARFLEDHGFSVTIQPNPAHDYLGLMHAARRST